MDFHKELSELFVRMGLNNALNEIRRLANISVNNKHYCKDCFSCYCLDYLVQNKYPGYNNLSK